MSLTSVLNIEKAESRSGASGHVKGGRAILTTGALPDDRNVERYHPAEGRFVFSTRDGLSTHFSPLDDNEVEGYVGQIINNDKNGLGDEASKLSSLVLLGENLYHNNGNHCIPNGTKFCVLPPDFFHVFGLEKDPLNKATRLNKLISMYHTSAKPSGGLFLPLVFPKKEVFGVAGLVHSTKNLWIRKSIHGGTFGKEDAITKITSITPNPKEPVTLATAPALFITSVRKLVGSLIKSTDDTAINKAITDLTSTPDFEAALEGVLKASYMWHSTIPTFVSSTSVLPGGIGSCISQVA